MRVLYVVAHPEAEHHVSGVVGGWHDSALTESGISAAHRIAAELRSKIETSDSVVVSCSDLRRASVTADVVAAKLGVTAIPDMRLREKSYGEAEGLPQQWLDARFLPPPRDGDRLNHYEGVRGSETKKQFADRIYEAMEQIVAREATNEVIVTHGFAVTFVIAAWVRMPVEATGSVNFRAPSGSISILREDDFFHNRQVCSLGDISHLNDD
jgi:probable phosphoglycerate mutase